MDLRSKLNAYLIANGIAPSSLREFYKSEWDKIWIWDISEPNISVIENISDADALEAYHLIAESETDNNMIYKVLGMMYKELSPLTPNETIRQNLKKWIRKANI